MSQEQLFDAGQVKTYSTRAKAWMNSPLRRELRARSLLANLIGSGRVRRHRVTGKVYIVEAGRPRPGHPKQCASCGAETFKTSREIRDRKGGVFYCSRACASKGWARELGATRVDSSGYVEIKTDDGWRKEHRVVMERVLGRELQETETVHHINGDRSDNRVDNLQLRRGQHGAGQVCICGDCGSENIVFQELAE